MPLTLTRRQAQNDYYDESIGEGVWPLRMMQIPAGSFTMGAPKDELESQDNERPQHKVTLGRFFMAKYPVTQAQWRAVVAMKQVSRELELDPSKFKGDHNPVEQISWYDAIEFCDRITLHTNRQYRLPTEAEWEYACRAGTTTPFHFGETISTDIANYAGSHEKYGAYGPGERGESRRKTSPVDQFEGVNAYGLSDMHGNIFEWCQDHWHDNYKDAPTDGSAWTQGGKSNRRVIRGGSWVYGPRNCRSACRNILAPDDRSSYLGFRVVCSAPRILP